MKYQFGAPKNCVEVFMPVRVLLRGVSRLPDAPAAREGLRDKVKAGVSLCYLDGKAVFPVARISGDALPFTTPAWQLPQRAIFSGIVPDLMEAAQFKVQLPVCTSNAGTSNESQHENFARAEA